MIIASSQGVPFERADKNSLVYFSVEVWPLSGAMLQNELITFYGVKQILFLLKSH